MLREYDGAIAAAVERLPVASAIIDAELVACNADGTPNFYAMMRGAPHGCCAYCFDLLEFDGRSLMVAPLEERRYLYPGDSPSERYPSPSPSTASLQRTSIGATYVLTLPHFDLMCLRRLNPVYS